jgi:hypothetical protein
VQFMIKAAASASVPLIRNLWGASEQLVASPLTKSLKRFHPTLSRLDSNGRGAGSSSCQTAMECSSGGADDQSPIHV